jgi:hypothetical protein
MNYNKSQSSVETFFLDCWGLTPFSFSFYDWLLIYDWTTYTGSRRTHRKHIQQWIYANHIESTCSSIVIFTARCLETEVIRMLPASSLSREYVYRVVAQQSVYMSQYDTNIAVGSIGTRRLNTINTTANRHDLQAVSPTLQTYLRLIFFCSQ